MHFEAIRRGTCILARDESMTKSEFDEENLSNMAQRS